MAETLEPRCLLSADVPDGFTDTQLVSGFFSPTSMSIAPDGSNRIFVTEQTGAIRLVKNGQLLTQPFATINCTNFGEHGLLGLTFDPNFTSNHYIYIYYTTPRDGNSEFHNRLARLTANGDVATANSEVDLFDADDLDVNQLYHDAGGLHFGPDGDIYVTVGENEHPNNSQDLTNLEGKMLRLKPDGSIPTDNPFFNTLTGKNRAIWAYGLRNPFTYAFQPGTGTMFIDDVGQDSWEEINLGTAGANYGWPIQEGQIGLGQNGITDPIFDYGHNIGSAITGGVFYPSTGSFPGQYLGQYFFSDIGGGWIHILNPSTHTESDFATGVGAPVDLDMGSDGALYYLGRSNAGDTRDNSGFISIIRYSAGQAPDIVSQPEDQQVGEGQSATFTVSASGQEPITFQWQKNGQDISGATDASYTIDAAAALDSGAQYRVIVTNPISDVTSNAATLTVLSDAAPVPTINLPKVGTTWYGGQTIAFSGSATDPDDGTLDASKFTWEVDYHTGTITRPFVQPFSGTTSSAFTTATITPYTKSDVFYRIILTVRDAQGLTATVTRDVVPMTANITVKTNVPGFIVTVDGEDTAAGGVTFNGVAGIAREIAAPDSQDFNGRTYVFDRWSDGGDQDHEISTPGKRYTYTAFYVPMIAKGLQVTYFNNKNETGTQITQHVNSVDFTLDGKPDASIARDNWAARFTGKFQAADDDNYTFSVVTDGAVRLLVNGLEVITSTVPTNSLHTLSGIVHLTGGGAKYPIVLDYIHNTGTAQLDFHFSNGNNTDQTVPNGLLYAPTVVTNTINPIADAYVQGGESADQNFGDSTDLLIKSYKSASFQRDAYLRFDLSDIDVITSAKLRVFGRLSGVQNADVMLGAFGAASTAFTDSSITYNNRPALSTLQGSALVSTSTTEQWYIIDLTAYFKSMKAIGQDQVTIALRNIPRTVTNTLLAAKEDSPNAPELVVTS